MTMLSLATILAEAARRYPDKTAVVDGELRIGYADLWRQSLAYAGGLRAHGIRPGDTVAMLVPNVADFPRVYYAILAAGAIVVPVHLLLAADEMAYVLRDSRADLLVSHAACAETGAAAATAAGVRFLTVATPPTPGGRPESASGASGRPDTTPAPATPSAGDRSEGSPAAGPSAVGDRLVGSLAASPSAGRLEDSSAAGPPAVGAGRPDTLSAPASGTTRLEDLATAEPLVSYVGRQAEDPAVVFYTSGTTGESKGAVLTHLNLVLNAMVNVFDANESHPDDVVLGCLPLFHTYGQTVAMNGTFRLGGTLVLLPRFTGEAALELMRRERVTVFHGVPTMYIGLLAAARSGGELPRLRLAISGGASLPVAVLDSFTEAFGTTVFEGYGLSETSPTATTNQPQFGVRPGTVGHPIWGVEVEIARAEIGERIELLGAGELGEIVIRGHNVFAGYLNRPEATAAAMVDGWFRTGDLGTKDGAGFVSIVDRIKDVIIRGGFNVYPREVEEVLARHPAIAQVAVIGLPDELHGEEICAVVVPTAPGAADANAASTANADAADAADAASTADTNAANAATPDSANAADVAGPDVAGADAGGVAGVSADELIAWARERLGRHKYPRLVRFVTELPMGPSQKVLKRELRRTITD